MGELRLPSNIKQIGSISSGSKIYIEDFVYTYLNQYAEAGDYCEKIAFLIGSYLIVGGEQVLFVCGAVQGQHTVSEGGMEVFSDRSFEYAQEQISKYFNGMEIVGWMQAQPGYGTRLNPQSLDYHKHNFDKSYQVVFLLDPTEKLSAFYSWDKDMNGVSEKSGYFIYYDKNNGMQEYMMQNRLSKYKVKEKPKPAAELFEEEEEEEEFIEAPVKKIQRRSYTEPVTTNSGRNRVAAEAPIVKRGSKNFEFSGRSDGKRIVNMLVTLSAVLFIICFIMGAGLIQNESRITALENDIDNLALSYNFLQSQVKSYEVYAGGDEPLGAPVVNTPKPTATPLAALVEPTLEPSGLATQAPVPSALPQATPEPTRPAVTETISPTASSDTGEEVDAINSDLPDTYTVQAGDTLSAISRKFYGTTSMINQIMELNEITDASKLSIGRVIKLPKR
jgi:LysM repeat protein